MQQGQPTPQTQSMQQGQPSPPQQFAQQAQPPQQSQQQQPPQQSQQQPPQAIGQQQMQSAQPTHGAAGGPAQFGQPSGAQPQPQPQGRGPQRPLLKPIRVNEIITEDVVTAERDTPVRTVVAQMAENDVGSVVVVEDDRPIGIITDRTVALALEEKPDITELTADDLLHGDVFTADPSMNIFDAIQVMSDEGIRRLPIVDDNGALRGIVTLDDTLVLLGGVVSEVSDTVQSQSPNL
ncbi:CBS domain-containing protein [Haloarcula rara]|uniref:CBS domain-containing protein n=1 Tax=Haloarcula rara TaxID=3033387 RepID=UPI0023E8B5B9|nr:CBS domain-containing protein [Halomicroarcula sp. SHR3]